VVTCQGTRKPRKNDDPSRAKGGETGKSRGEAGWSGESRRKKSEKRRHAQYRSRGANRTSSREERMEKGKRGESLFLMQGEPGSPRNSPSGAGQDFRETAKDGSDRKTGEFMTPVLAPYQDRS